MIRLDFRRCLGLRRLRRLRRTPPSGGERGLISQNSGSYRTPHSVIGIKTHAACSTKQMQKQNRLYDFAWRSCFPAPVWCIYFRFSLVHCVVNVCCDWPLSLLWFWFDNTPVRTAGIMWKPSWWLKRICWVVFVGLDGNLLACNGGCCRKMQ